MGENSGNITFRFKQFALTDRRCGMKIGTDGVLAGALATLLRPDGRVADVGAGCGVIALMIAQRYPDATVDAVEIDPGAACDLRVNVANSPWAGRINVVEGDFNAIHGTFDLIVSNPPYYNNGDVAPDASRALARHAASLSPLSLVDFAVSRLAPGGVLAMIVPADAAADVEEAAVFARLSLARRVDVATSRRRGVTRTFIEFSADPYASPQSATLSTDSEEYRALTRDFYLDR